MTGRGAPRPTRTKARRLEAGFTLIELLVVIMILAVIAVIVVYDIGRTDHDAVSSTCRTSVNTIVLAAEAVDTKTGAYPTDQAAMLSANDGHLTRWPGGTDPSQDDLVYAYSVDSAHGYGITIAGRLFTAPRTVYGDDTSASAVSAACTP